METDLSSPGRAAASARRRRARGHRQTLLHEGHGGDLQIMTLFLFFGLELSDDVQCPFNNNMSFMNGGTSHVYENFSLTLTTCMSPWLPTVEQLLTFKFSWTCALVFIEIKRQSSRFCRCPPVSERNLCLLSSLLCRRCFALGSGQMYMICVTLFCDKNVRQNHATKSDTSGHCILCTLKIPYHSLHQWYLPISLCSTRSKPV